MEIKYYGIGSNLKEILFEEFNKNKEILYVFENGASFYEIKKEYLKTSQNLFYNFKLMDKVNFYEKLFQTNKIVVKEEKQVILFFKSLSPKLKKALKINSYYDSIDIAYNFYNLFSELQEYKINIDNIKLEEWQSEIFENLKKIDKEIKQKIEEENLILPYMLRNIENISEIFIQKNKKIVFINKIKFTPFEKEIIEVLEKKGIEIENILLLDKESFDEKNLKIKENFEINQNKNINIEIFEFENKFSQVIGLINEINKNKKIERKIYDVQNEVNDEVDYQLLNQNKIIHNLEITMKNTKIYKILDLLYNILESSRVIQNEDSGIKLIFKVKDLYNAFKYDDFLKVFNLMKINKLFQEIVNKEYKYISVELLENFMLENENKYKENILILKKFLEKLEEIYRFENLKEYSKFLEKIINDFEKDINKDKDNVKEKYFEALTELEVIEKIFLDKKLENDKQNINENKEKLWGEKYFDRNTSANLLKLFLKYLDKKAISMNLEEINENEEQRYAINSFDSISEIKKENIIFINLQDSFPKIKINNFLFSKIQRAELGLPTSESEKQFDIIKFYQNILGATNVYLSYVKNHDEKMDSAGVVEEIKLKWNIEVKKNNVSEDEYIYFIKKYFLEKNKKYEKKEIGQFIPSKLEKDLEKIKNEILNLGYYSYKELENFEYGFYLNKKIKNIEKEEINEKIDSLMFGILIHQLYEKIIMINKDKIESGLYEVNKVEIEEIFRNILISYGNKLPKEYIVFYERLSFEEIINGVENFLKSLLNEIKNLTNVKIKYEEKIKNRKEENFLEYENVKISGVADLHLISDTKEILFDYKSGKVEKDKLKQAFEQLDFYNILISNNEKSKTKEIAKWIINAWNGKEKINKEKIKDRETFAENEFGRKKEEILTKDKIEETLKNYFNKEYYDLGSKKDFLYNLYKDVVRREDEKNGENSL